MRALFVANDVPYPAISGIRQRFANLILGMATVAEVDAFLVAGPDQPVDEEALAASPLSRFTVVPPPPLRPAPERLARWALRAGGRPAELIGRDWSAALDELSTWAGRNGRGERGERGAAGYDVVLMTHRMVPDFAAPVRSLGAAAIIADFDNLESSSIALRVASRPPVRRTNANDLARRAMGRVDVGRWRRLERKISATTDLVFVCSELDRRRLGHPGAAVVPNGYTLDGPPAGRPTEVREPPVITMVGSMHYRPNFDGARWFREEVLPQVTAARRGTRLRIVGNLDSSGGTLALAGPDVDVVGLVPDITVELSQADLVIAPLLSGGGTRVKILEAFAHRIPVVTTTVGCEGLDVEDGVDLLVADTADAFARACITLLTDLPLRRRLTDAAHERYMRSYRGDSIQRRIGELVRGLADRPTSSSS